MIFTLISLSLIFYDAVNSFGYRAHDTPSQWDSVTYWSPQYSCPRITVVRTSEESELKEAGDDDHYQLDGYGESLNVNLYDLQIIGNAELYDKLDGMLGDLHFKYNYFGQFDAGLNIVSDGREIISDETASMNIDLRFGGIVDVSQDIMYSLENSMIYTKNETVNKLFIDGHNTLNETIVVRPYENGGGFFKNHVASVKVTNRSKFNWWAVGRLTNDIDFQLGRLWFQINATYGRATFESLPCTSNDTANYFIEAPFAGGRMARLTSARHALYLRHNRFMDAYNVKVKTILNEKLPTMDFSEKIVRVSDVFLYNIARRRLTLADDDKEANEQLEVNWSSNRPFMQLNGPNRTLTLKTGRRGPAVICRDDSRKFVVTVDGFRVHRSRDTFTFNRKTMTLTMKTIVDETVVDIFRRKSNIRYQPEKNHSASKVEDTWETHPGFAFDYIDFTDQFMHMTYDNFIVHLDVTAGEVRTNAGVADWRRDGGFRAQCATGEFRAHAATDASHVNGRRVSASLTANRLYAYNDARQLTFKAQDDELVLRKHGVKLVIN